MGQRSQIYISYDVTDHRGARAEGFIARYYNWNFGERMVSRARYAIEHLKERLDRENSAGIKKASFFFPSELDKLVRICDTNFDMKDVCISTDILAEIKEQFEGDMSYLFDQPNNNGQLLIRVTDEGIRYCFLLDDGEALSVRAYAHHEAADTTWDEETTPYTEDNIKAINEMAEIMSQDEAAAFFAADYSKFLDRRIIIDGSPS